MHHTRQSIVLGTAFFAVVAIWPSGTQAFAGPNSETQATIEAEPTPYQEGYEKGRADGYARGEARAMNHCARDYFAAWPQVGTGAYAVGYSEGFELAYVRGFEDGFAKHCRPA